MPPQHETMPSIPPPPYGLAAAPSSVEDPYLSTQKKESLTLPQSTLPVADDAKAFGNGEDVLDKVASTLRGANNLLVQAEELDAPTESDNNESLCVGQSEFTTTAEAQALDDEKNAAEDLLLKPAGNSAASSAASIDGVEHSLNAIHPALIQASQLLPKDHQEASIQSKSKILAPITEMESSRSGNAAEWSMDCIQETGVVSTLSHAVSEVNRAVSNVLENKPRSVLPFSVATVTMEKVEEHREDVKSCLKEKKKSQANSVQVDIQKDLQNGIEQTKVVELELKQQRTAVQQARANVQSILVDGFAPIIAGTSKCLAVVIADISEATGNLSGANDAVHQMHTRTSSAKNIEINEYDATSAKAEAAANKSWEGKGPAAGVAASLFNVIRALKIRAEARTNRIHKQFELAGFTAAMVDTSDGAKDLMEQLGKAKTFAKKLQAFLDTLAKEVAAAAQELLGVCNAWESEVEKELTIVLAGKETLARNLIVWTKEQRVGKATNWCTVTEKRLKDAENNEEMVEMCSDVSDSTELEQALAQKEAAVESNAAARTRLEVANKELAAVLESSDYHALRAELIKRGIAVAADPTEGKPASVSGFLTWLKDKTEDGLVAITGGSR